MIRVLHIVTQMNRAGLENRLMDIYREIDKSSIQFDFYTNRTSEGLYDQEIIAMGGRVYYSGSIQRTGVYKKVKEFDSFLKEHGEYQIVHSHVNEWSTLFCYAAKRNRIPVRIAHSRGANNEKSIKRVIKSIIKFPINHYANYCFAVSEKAGVHLFGNRMNKRGRIKILPNAVDCNKFKFNENKRVESRIELGCANAFVVVHVGNFTNAKNHRFLIDVFANIWKKDSNAILYLAGDGEKRSSVQEYVNELGLSHNVYFLGSYSKVDRLLQAADIFIFPSLHEGFPGAVLEAEAAGVPCIISDTITEEVVLTENCTRFSLERSAEDWANKAIEISQGGHADTFTLLSEKGYDIKTLAEEYKDFYLLSVNG